MERGGIYRALDGEKFDRIKYQSRYLSLKKRIQSGHPIDPDELKKLNKYMINPLGEDDVLNKIEDIRLHPSRYSQLFQELPSMISKSKDAKPRLVNVTDQDNLQKNNDGKNNGDTPQTDSSKQSSPLTQDNAQPKNDQKQGVQLASQSDKTTSDTNTTSSGDSQTKNLLQKNILKLIKMFKKLN